MRLDHTIRLSGSRTRHSDSTYTMKYDKSAPYLVFNTPADQGWFYLQHEQDLSPSDSHAVHACSKN